MARVLPALEGLPPAFLVGGAVRDLLRGASAVDLDIAIEGDARAAARTLADRVGGVTRGHERFGTATVTADDLSADLSTTRRETYERPGALPTIEEAPLAEDLGRRDFTINAMAIGLSGDDLGHLYDPHGGGADLDAGVVRVLHERSFEDDPTRLLRALRYEARLGFAMDADTERLARAAASQEPFASVSGARVRDELMDLLTEPQAPTALERLGALGLDRALHPALAVDPELAAAASLGAVAVGAERALAALAALCSPEPAELLPWLDELNLRAPERDAVARAVLSAGRIAAESRRKLRPSEVHALMRGEPLESAALALALRSAPEPLLRWASELRHVRLEIDGNDLLAAGVPESPALGRALEETLRRKLDGELAGRDEELQAALELAREDLG